MASSQTRSKIIETIGSVESDETKAVLMMMLGMIEDMEEISKKIDLVLADEGAIRNLVLNGAAPHHSEHHVWVAEKIAEEKVNKSESRQLIRAIIKTVATLIIGGAGTLMLLGLAEWVRTAATAVPH